MYIRVVYYIVFTVIGRPLMVFAVNGINVSVFAEKLIDTESW